MLPFWPMPVSMAARTKNIVFHPSALKNIYLLTYLLTYLTVHSKWHYHHQNIKEITQWLVDFNNPPTDSTPDKGFNIWSMVAPMKNPI